MNIQEREISPSRNSFIKNRVEFKETPYRPEFKRHRSNINRYSRARQSQFQPSQIKFNSYHNESPRAIKIPSNPKLEQELMLYFRRKRQSKVENSRWIKEL